MPSLRTRLNVSAECATWMFTVALIQLTWRLWSTGQLGRIENVAVAASVPALVCLTLSLVAAIVPGFVATIRLARPLNFTMPIVFGCLTIVLMVLGFGPPDGLQKMAEPLRAASMWNEPMFLGETVVIQILLLTITIRSASKAPHANLSR